jgi:hypothetical protein
MQDSCGGELANGTESWANQYSRWSKALSAAKQDMVFLCSWAVYYTICVANHPGKGGEKACGATPWLSGQDNIGDLCHLWRYGTDLAPTWTRGGGRNMRMGPVVQALEISSSPSSMGVRFLVPGFVLEIMLIYLVLDGVWHQ